MNKLTILAALLATGCTIELPPEPRGIHGYGLVGCEVTAEDGSRFRMTINDQADQMIVRTSLNEMFLPRDEELTDSDIHVGALTDGIRTIAVTLNGRLEATVTTINDVVTTGDGQCERI